MVYQIDIINIGKTERCIVSDLNGNRPAQFKDKEAAQEACRIISSLRMDSAFKRTRIVEVK